MENQEETESPKKRGHIDLVALFQAEANDLLNSVKRGRLMHATKNIRDSGAPFEKTFRDIWATRLPSITSILHGYLFDLQSNCTPQIDAILIDAGEDYRFMSSPDGANYLPYTCAIAVFELKTSAVKAHKHLDQLAAISSSIAGMRNASCQPHSSGPIYHPPLSVMIFAESRGAKWSDLKGWYERNQGKTPSLVLFLDRGMIIANRSHLEASYAERNSKLTFYEATGHGVPFVFAPQEDSQKTIQGRAFLWLYFALLARINFHRGNNSHILGFTNDAASAYEIFSRGAVSTADDWPVNVEERSL